MKGSNVFGTKMTDSAVVNHVVYVHLFLAVLTTLARGWFNFVVSRPNYAW